MSKTEISTAGAKELKEAGFTLSEIREEYTIVAGAANVAAQAQVAVPESTPELVAAATLLFSEGTTRKATTSGRPKRTLGTKEGTYPYNVSVTIDPNFEG